MIPPAFIHDLLARVDIVEVVGRHVQLKKAGINLRGCARFTARSRRASSVSPTKQFYHCFGCGAHGDAIGFLIEHTGMGFVDAVQGPRPAGRHDRAGGRPLAAGARARRGAEAAAGDAQRRARQGRRRLPPAAQGSPRAIDYLKGRGLSGEIAARFGLGYAPDGWRGLASVFPRYDDPLLEESGLVIAQEAESGDEAERKRYDRFRDRIMFPIRSVQGEVIGFGGRVLDAASRST